MIIDLRWAEIHYELWALREHLGAIERQLKNVEAQERERIFSELREKGFADNEAEVSLAHQEFWELTENVLPRYFRGSFLVVLWAVYESAVTEVASRLQKEKQKTLGIRDIRGNNSLDIAKRYFEHVLEFPLFTPQQQHYIDRIEILQTVRNAIAHGNGRKDSVNKNVWEKIEKWQKTGIGISMIRNEFITFDEKFLKETYSLINDFVTELIERVKAE